jgi:hypothetical protein
MTWSPDSSTTGSAQTGLTSPTYTLVSDTPPAINAKKHVVTTLGGTQTGASANSASKPFDVTVFKPAVFKQLPAANPVTGLRGQIPVNQTKIVVRKGCDVASGVTSQAVCRLTIDVPAGAETYAPVELLAMLSFLIGILTEESADLGETIVTGVL